MLFQSRPLRQALLVPLMALSLTVSACQQGENTNTSSTPPEANTQNTTQTNNQTTLSLSGAGASFPAPLYQRWFKDYNTQNPNIEISYQSVGSGAGVKQFMAGTVDFGASDGAMKPEEIAQVSKGVLLLPMTAGSIVLAYNLPGVDGLKLSRQTYVDILLGKITQWNDPAIAADNPGLSLPDQPIQVVYRSDGSGTTEVFTKHLSAISEEWKAGPGEAKTVEWPVGVGAKGNEGVTAQIKQNQGAIGYVEFSYASLQGLQMTTLENKAGNFVAPSFESASKTLEAVTLPEDLVAFIADPDGPDSYPIVTYTWLLAYKQYDNPEKAKALREVLKWSLTEGQKVSKDLGYIPLPENVVSKVQASVDTIKP
jgi:phosphate transport system substrate-binding protein